MLFRYCCPLKSLNVLRIIANIQYNTIPDEYEISQRQMLYEMPAFAIIFLRNKQSQNCEFVL